jgi:glycosyltransferase involved in cell wall biosynthesis
VLRELSVVIPTFNRRARVGNAIRSALGLVPHAATEIIVVDDASSDGTVAELQSDFGAEIESRLLRLVRSETNIGATGAKNLGASAACGEWLVFLDSDDELRAEGLATLVTELRNATSVPVVFFRCASRSGHLIGSRTNESQVLTVRDVVAWRWGECLPVVRREAFARFSYDVDLRGYEGLAYARMTRALGSARLSPLVARVYDEDSTDRLSTGAGIRARSCELARGHWRALVECWREFGAAGILKQWAKVVYYAMACLKLRSKAIFKASVA